MINILRPLVLGLSLFAITNFGVGQITLNPVSSVRNGDAVEIFDESAAEIVKYDAVTQRMFVVNGAIDSIDIFDVSDIESPVLFRSVDLSEYGNPNSVDVNPMKARNEVAVAVGSGNAGTRGSVVFMSKEGVIKESVSVGYLPDMLTYAGKGQQVVVANEGEPSGDYTIDPEGSVSIIDTRGKKYKVTEVTFDGIEEADLNGARISGPDGTTIAQDLEPEFIAICDNDRFAYVACQENNAIAVVDLKKREIVRIFGLGTKNFADLGNSIDASDKDDVIRIANWPVKGLYMPDSIECYKVNGKQYIVTANEGDGREYVFENDLGEEETSFVDEERIEDLELDESAFPLGEVLKERENLGRLKAITTQGDIDGDGDFDQLYTFGARSLSIFSVEGELVFDSGDFIERYIAEHYPEDFNSTNDENGSFDDRSDAKGPEPEALALGEINGRTYAFLGLERQGGIMIFDITNPTEVAFVDYFNNRDFSVQFVGEDEEGEDIILPIVANAGDLGPEGIDFVPAKKSPSGQPIIIVANEVSGTTTVYEIEIAE